MSETEKEIEYKFKADLSGWLEHEQKYSQFRQDSGEVVSAIDNLLDTFTTTLAFYDNSNEAFKALHKVLFKALLKRDDYRTDFDVPPFEHGVDYEQFYRISSHFDLFRYTCYSLWTIPGTDAIGFIINMSERVKLPLKEYHTTFIQLIRVHDPATDLDYTSWITKQLCMADDAKAPTYINYLIQTIYKCLVDNKSKSSDNSSSKRLLDILKSLLASVKLNNDISHQVGFIYKLYPEDWLRQYLINDPESKLFIRFKLKDCSQERSEVHNVKRDWEQLIDRKDIFTEREKTFLVICDHIKKQSFYGERLESVSTEELEKLEQLEKLFHSKYAGHRSQAWCCFIIKRRCVFWKSVLKLIVQFMDLWIDELDEAECTDVFAYLIARENLSLVLYDSLMRNIQLYAISKDETRLVKIHKMTSLLYESIGKMEDIEDILLLRDCIYEEREANQSPELPMFGAMTFWNIPYENRLIRISNQITSSNEDEEVYNDTIKDLCVLSTIWPYKVTRFLFTECAQNANQYQIIIPILKKLGRLCRLKKTNTPSLLVTILKECMGSSFYPELDKAEDNIAQFVENCFDQEQDRKFPLILIPESRADQQLLNFVELLERIIQHYIPLFVDHKEQRGARIALLLLDRFCYSDVENQWHPNALMRCINPSDPPVVVGHLNEDVFAELTGMYFCGTRMSMGDIERAIRFINIFCQIAAVTIRRGDSYPAYLAQISLEVSTVGYKHVLLWLPVIYAIDVKKYNKYKPIRINYCLYQIIGDLEGRFIPDNEMHNRNEPDYGQMLLIDACRVSITMTDIIFEYVDQWRVHMPSLFLHPYENKYTTKVAASVFYEYNLIRTTTDYENVYGYFLNKLYDFEGPRGLEEKMKSYPYDSIEVRDIVQRLNSKGLKSYYIVLTLILFINQSITYQHNSLSFALKKIQEQANWSEISQDGRVEAYKYLKAKAMASLNAPPTESETLIYYPILSTEDLVSNRALSVLVLYHLCVLMTQFNKDYELDSIYRLIVQVLDGLIDRKSRQQFESMMQAQPKNRRTNWKKRPTRLFVEMRPVLLGEESKLILPVIEQANFTKSTEILQTLTTFKDEQKLYLL